MSYIHGGVGPSLKHTSHSEKEIEQIDQMIGGLFATMYKNYYLPISLFVCGSFQQLISAGHVFVCPGHYFQVQQLQQKQLCIFGQVVPFLYKANLWMRC